MHHRFAQIKLNLPILPLTQRSPNVIKLRVKSVSVSVECEY